MSEAIFSIVRKGETWTIDHDGIHQGDYATKEAAFEAIYAAASNAIKEGFAVRITVPQRAPGETAMGGAP
jgi:hypothetical protein